MRNLETQVGQLAKQMVEQQEGQFLENTQTNPKEQCKAITIRCGKHVGSDVGTEVADDKKKLVDGELEAEINKNRLKDRVEPEAVITEESRDSEPIKAKEGSVEESVQKQTEKGQNWRKIEEGIPLKHVLYPYAPSRREAERQFIRFTEILKNLQINIPFTEAMQQMPTYVRFLKELLTKKRKFPEDETVELEAGCNVII